MNLNKLLKRPLYGSTSVATGLPESSSAALKDIQPLSEDNNPNVKKLKKELEKLVIKPSKPKYIKIDLLKK